MSDVIQVLPIDADNDLLVRNVHPRDWVNPEPAPRYNLVVIGAGTAGLVTAAGAAGLGARVALIERDLLGGDCLNVGCVPSKALIRASRAAAEVRGASAFGIGVPASVPVDFGAVMARMRRLRAELSQRDSAQRFQGLGVDVFLGSARFTGPDAVTVAGKTLRFRRAVLATGARAARPTTPGLAEIGYLTNETVFSLIELPRRLAVVGAGPIGCELAQAFARFGSVVTLIGKQPTLLPREDPQAAAIVAQALRRDGVKLLLGCEPLRAARTPAGKVLHLDPHNSVEVDEILVGVGRAPNVEGLDLEAAGVRYSAKGVDVDDRLRTSNPRIFAAGDICSRYQFTHAADALARIAIQNALFFGRARSSALIMPWCTYTDPEIAHVGLYVHEAAEQGIAVDRFIQEMGQVDRAVLDGDAEGYVEVLVRKGTDRIVGGTIVARHAGEMISELTLAMVGKLGLGTLGRTIHPYPTQAEALKKIADAYHRTRLTPFVKGLFQRWFQWRQ